MPGTDGRSPERLVPLSLRPSRRPLLVLLPLLATCLAPAVATVLLGENGALRPWRGLVPLGTAGAVLLVRPVLLLLRGYTEIGPEGVTSRLTFLRRSAPWHEVRRFVVKPTPFGRSVRVILDQGWVRLAAPREGLLARGGDFDDTLRRMRGFAAAHRSQPPNVEHVPPRPGRVTYTVGGIVVAVGFGLFFVRPWLEPWWPTRDEATSIPRACAVADQETARRLVPDARQDQDRYRDDDSSTVSRCLWRQPGRSGALGLQIDLRGPVGLSSGTDQAREKFPRAVESTTEAVDGTPEPVPQLGAAARRLVISGSGEDPATSVYLLVRRANVIIEVGYLTERPRDQATAEADRLARAALDRVPIS